MPSSSILRARGLYTFSNYFTSVPEGGLLVADNVVIDRDGIIEPRRGISDYGKVGNSSANVIKQLFVYKNRILSFLNGELYFDDGNGNATAVTIDGTTPFTFASQGKYRPKGLETQGNFYFTSNTGIKKISTASVSDFVSTPGSTPIAQDAGAPRAPDIALKIDLTTPNGFLPSGDTVAYRIVWGYKDNNSNLILGYPSFNAQLTNTTSSGYGVVITAQIPPELITSPTYADYFYQVYRSLVSTTAPAADELNQVYEANLLSSDISSGIVNIYDNTPETIRNSGTPLYTNEYSGSGITSANSAPPMAQDLTLYKNITFYANTLGKQTLNFTMQGTDGFNVIDGVTAITYSGGVSTFNVAHNMPVGSTSTVVLFYGNTAAAAVYTASFPSSTSITISGTNFSSITPSNVSIFTSHIDVYYGATPSTQRFYFVGRPTHTSLVVGTNKAGMASQSSFSISNADNTIRYLFWFKLVSTDKYTGSVPAGSSLVAIDLTDAGVVTSSDVAGVTVTAMNKTGDFYCTSSGSTVSIVTSESGTVSTVNAPAIILTPGAGWSITQTLDGTGESIASKFIKLSSSVSAGIAIESTSKSLISVVSSNIPSLDMFYTSDSSALPGSITAIATTYNAPAISFVSDLLLFSDSSHATGNMFNPAFGTSVDSTQAYTQAETHLNRIYYSKQYQPDSVPDLNYIDIGPKDKAILRIIALRNTLFILKEEAIYSLTGTDSTNFYITLFDSSTLLVAPDTAQVLNNQIYMLSSQGVATVTETGVGIISRPVEDIFTRIKNPLFTHYDTASFAVTYESDRAYILFTVYNYTDTYATKAYRYNTFTQGWTSWTWNAACGIVNPITGVDKLFLGSSVDNTLEVERKNLSRTDYADKQYTLDLFEDSLNGATLKVSSVGNVAIGDILVQTQYLTISDFNRLLIKLDRDGAYNPLTFVATYTAAPTDNLGRKLSLLTAAINAIDSSISISSGNSDFATSQTEFNHLADQLNASIAVTNFKDYPHSVGTVNQEMLIDSFAYYQNLITVDTVTPVIFGPITLYKGIQTQVVWAPVSFGDPGVTKHIREGTFLFEFDAIASATVAYASDLSPNFETITFGMEGDGSWGHNTWSGNTWGGQGSSRPFRTLIPRQKQRCRFIRAQFNHVNAYYKFSILGISFTYEMTSSRGYR